MPLLILIAFIIFSLFDGVFTKIKNTLFPFLFRPASNYGKRYIQNKVYNSRLTAYKKAKIRAKRYGKKKPKKSFYLENNSFQRYKKKRQKAKLKAYKRRLKGKKRRSSFEQRLTTSLAKRMYKQRSQNLSSKRTYGRGRPYL